MFILRLLPRCFFIGLKCNYQTVSRPDGQTCPYCPGVPDTCHQRRPEIATGMHWLPGNQRHAPPVAIVTTLSEDNWWKRREIWQRMRLQDGYDDDDDNDDDDGYEKTASQRLCQSFSIFRSNQIKFIFH